MITAESKKNSNKFKFFLRLLFIIFIATLTLAFIMYFFSDFTRSGNVVKMIIFKITELIPQILFPIGVATTLCLPLLATANKLGANTSPGLYWWIKRISIIFVLTLCIEGFLALGGVSGAENARERAYTLASFYWTLIYTGLLFLLTCLVLIVFRGKSENKSIGCG